ncbi:MAG: hypothetical protein M1834_008817 [Cirrosporium novae-zelandiae]|nr:MAG: hypothetical protein M1834_008817 [Cirrosporium novae-zelandiae]
MFSSRSVTFWVENQSLKFIRQSSLRRNLQTSEHYSSRSSNPKFSSRWTRSIGLVTALVATTVATHQYYIAPDTHAEAPPIPVEIRLPEERRKSTSKEDNRDLISSQHLQVKKSWENPGVYAWGSNIGKVAAPDSDDLFIKSPRRIPFFNGQLLRDVKLDRNFGAAITENGDLIQWGTGYSKENFQPTVTLKGKDLESVSLSEDRIITLSKGGQVYSLPVSKSSQASGPKLSESSWIPFRSGRSKVSYRILELQDMSWGEKVSQIAGGLHHVLLLTNKGRIFSAASATEAFPSKGQLGIPGLTWSTRPEGPADKCHEVSTLRGFEITKVAAGDYHSLAIDRHGRAFSFGDNTSGQLGLEFNSDSPYIDAPSLLSFQTLYRGTNQTPKVTDVAAGGLNSFFTVDATRMAGQGETGPRLLNLGRVTADTWACGQGIFGGLGNGHWTHVQSTPSRIKALSGLFEYDEKKSAVVPIRLLSLSVGATHASAIMDNVTNLGASDKTSENDTNWGADVLWWGGNEFYQLGTGKRNNVNNPTYIPPMDVSADREMGRREDHRFQITPRKKVKVGGHWVNVEQKIECGRFVSAVYSAI